jgi:mono/diheme cytochrome c family protein
VSAGPDIPLLGLDWDELPAVRVRRLPYWTLPIAYCLIVFSFILLAMAYVARNTYHTVNRISIIPDMDNEPRWKTQQANYMFADHRASRPWPDGAVPRGLLENDDHYYRGIVGGAWATGLPAQLTIDRALLERGRQRYNIYCTPCHGEAGYGDGMVAQHADMLKEGTWTQPLNYHTDQVRSRPDGHIFNTITNGIRTMPPYGSQIPVADRWAIVAWIRVLQASQGADLSSLPADKQAELLKRKPAVEPTPAQQAGATAGELVQQPDGSLAGAAATQPPAQRETGLPAGPPPSPENVPQGSTK